MSGVIGSPEESVAIRRIKLLNREWEMIAKKMGFSTRRVFLHPDILMEVVGSFYRQLEKFKRDQDIANADRHKSGGFMMYWICQLRPVQVLVSTIDESAEPPGEEEILANELFAIKVGLSCLNCSSDLVGDFDFFDTLIRRLRERDCPPEYLSSMLYLYERLHQSK